MAVSQNRIPNPGFFDAHCDTVMKVLDDGEGFLDLSEGKHVSFAGMVEADIRAQIFACFVLSAHHPGAEFERACQMIDAVRELVEVTDGQLCVAETRDELQEAFRGGPRAAILALEGADPLGDDAEKLREFYDRGVRSLIFAWQDNAFSGTAFGRNSPLTDRGRHLLDLCEELGVVVDVSHLSDSAFDEVASRATKPFVASHSNCRALCSSLRNLSDDRIRALADAGGVMGMNLAPSFLSDQFAAVATPLYEASRRPGVTPTEQESIHAEMLRIPRPKLESIAAHVCHAIQVGGEDCVGFGGDLDGIEQTPDGLSGIADYVKFPALLHDAGLSYRQIEKVCYGSFLRVYAELLPASWALSP